MSLTAEQEKVVAAVFDQVNGRMAAMQEPLDKMSQLIERLAATKGSAGESLSRILNANGKILGADDPFTFGDWMRALRDSQHAKSDNARKQAWDRLDEHYATQIITDNGVRQNLGEATGATGAFLVPQEFRNELLQAAGETAIVRPRARIIPMASRSMLIPALDVTTVPTAGQSAFFGGVVASWTEVGTTKTSTDPKLKQVELVVHELAGFTQVANALIADSGVSLEPLIRALFGDALAWYEDYAFLQGDGAGKPLGILNSGATISVTRNTATDFKLADSAAMLAKFVPASIGRGVWIMHITVLEKLVQFADANNVIWIPNAVEALPMRLHGMPVLFTEKMPALGTKGDVTLADLNWYLIGDRNDLDMSTSEHSAFKSNETVFRFSERVAGQPWIDAAITLQDATSTISPFVTLN